MLLLDLCGEVLDEGFLLGYADATLYATQLAAEAGFPPRVRGCYPSTYALGEVPNVSSSGTRMLR